MKIGIISDTHLLNNKSLIDAIVHRQMQDVDLIVHAGDIISYSVLEAFEGKNWVAVRGNADLPEVRKTLPFDHLLLIKGFRIGIVHDIKSVDDLPRRYGTLDCLIFGHSHHPANYLEGYTLYFNPGSATNNRRLPFNSIGIISLEDKLKGEIVDLRNF